MERSKEDGKGACGALRAAEARARLANAETRLAAVEARLAAVEARLADVEAALAEAVRMAGPAEGSGAHWGKGPVDIHGNPVPYC